MPPPPPQKGGPSVALIVLLVVVAFLVLGGGACAACMVIAARESTHVAEAPVRTLTSRDGKLEIDVPLAWTEDLALNDKATIGAKHVADDLYVVVLAEAKEDLVDMTLEKFSERRRTVIVDKLAGGAAVGPTRPSVRAGPALEYDLSGANKGVNVVMLHTVVETEHQWVQVLTWTLKSNITNGRATLERVTRSLREKGATRK